MCGGGRLNGMHSFELLQNSLNGYIPLHNLSWRDALLIAPPAPRLQPVDAQYQRVSIRFFGSGLANEIEHASPSKVEVHVVLKARRAKVAH